MKVLYWMLVFSELISEVVYGEEIRIATDGITRYLIVTPAKPSMEETTAADWLSSALGRVTGAEFSIHKEEGTNLAERCLYVGDTAAAREAGLHIDTLKPEEWHIRTAGQSLILAGGRPRGTIYAVTEFLESEVGLLILAPFTEVVPSRPSLTLQTIERSGRPAFAVRAIFTGFPYGHPAMSGRSSQRGSTSNASLECGTTGGFINSIRRVSLLLRRMSERFVKTCACSKNRASNGSRSKSKTSSVLVSTVIL